MRALVEQPICPVPSKPTQEAVSLVEKVRATVEARHRERLAKLDRAVLLLDEVLRESAPMGEALVFQIKPTGEHTKLTPSRMVLAAVRTFGTSEFSVGDLHRSLGDLFPGIELARATVCRRLYDLQRGKSPAVVRVQKGTDESERLKPKKGRYRCTCSPVPSPL